MSQKRFLTILVALLGLVILARPTFILLTHNFQEETDNAYFIYKHVKKRKQDYDDTTNNIFLSRTENSIAKRLPFVPSVFITAHTQPSYEGVSLLAFHKGFVLPARKTYLLTGKLTI